MRNINLRHVDETYAPMSQPRKRSAFTIPTTSTSATTSSTTYRDELPLTAGDDSWCNPFGRSISSRSPIMKRRVHDGKSPVDQGIKRGDMSWLVPRRHYQFFGLSRRRWVKIGAVMVPATFYAEGARLEYRLNGLPSPPSSAPRSGKSPGSRITLSMNALRSPYP